MAKHNKKKFNKISNVKPVITTREEAKVAYLLFDKYPTSTSKNEKIPEIIPIKNKLYSISQIARFGIHTMFAQNK